MKNLKKISLLALSLGLVGTSFTVEASGVGSTAGFHQFFISFL